MHQRDLNRAVAQATDESVTTISRLGLIPLDPASPREPRFLDWDQFDEQRGRTAVRPLRRPVAAVP